MSDPIPSPLTKKESRVRILRPDPVHGRLGLPNTVKKTFKPTERIQSCVCCVLLAL